jgi:hypothetical protein
MQYQLIDPLAQRKQFSWVVSVTWIVVSASPGRRGRATIEKVKQKRAITLYSLANGVLETRELDGDLAVKLAVSASHRGSLTRETIHGHHRRRRLSSELVGQPSIRTPRDIL